MLKRLIVAVILGLSTPALVPAQPTYDLVIRPVGFRAVIVNGTVVIEDGKHTGARTGQILLRPGDGRREAFGLPEF